jgi:hypothetical protein
VPEISTCEFAPIELPDSAMTCARMRLWVTEARAGARLAYAVGVSARQACSAELVNYVARLAELELVRPHFTRVDGAGTYLVVRTKRPVPAGVRL